MTIDLNGASLYYEQHGQSGKPLLLLHGWGGKVESWLPVIRDFQHNHRITVLDFPGHGRSGQPPRPWNVTDYMEQTAALIRALKIEGADIMAHSFGGRVAVKLLAEGNAFDRAVLAGCAGIVPRRTPGYRARVRAYRIVRKFAPRYAEKHFGSAEYRQLSPLMRESYKKIVNEDLRADAARIARPVLFINGAEDEETPLSSIRIYLSCVKGSRLFCMEGCGHFAHLENPLAFNAAAEEFLR